MEYPRQMLHPLDHISFVYRSLHLSCPSDFGSSSFSYFTRYPFHNLVSNTSCIHSLCAPIPDESTSLYLIEDYFFLHYLFHSFNGDYSSGSHLVVHAPFESHRMITSGTLHSFKIIVSSI